MGPGSICDPDWEFRSDLSKEYGIMSSRTAEEIAGLEFDWIACDAEQRVALFSTAGGGAAPAEFLLDTEAHDAAIEALLTMPGRTTARVAPCVADGLRNTWKLAAERGLFAFDADPYGGPYRLVAAPAEPCLLRSLPGAVRDVAARIRFSRCSFERDAVIRSVDRESR